MARTTAKKTKVTKSTASSKADPTKVIKLTESDSTEDEDTLEVKDITKPISASTDMNKKPIKPSITYEKDVSKQSLPRMTTNGRNDTLAVKPPTNVVKKVRGNVKMKQGPKSVAYYTPPSVRQKNLRTIVAQNQHEGQHAPELGLAGQRGGTKRQAPISPADSSPPAKRIKPIDPPTKISKEEYDLIDARVKDAIEKYFADTIQNKYRTLDALAEIAIKLDISDLDRESEDVPSLFTRHMENICADMTDVDEEWVIAQRRGASGPPTFLEKIQALTGRDKKHPDMYVRLEAIYGKGKTPWAGLSAIQDRFDFGNEFFDCENLKAKIQAILEGLARSDDEEALEFLTELTDAIDEIHLHSKRRTVFTTQQSALRMFMSIFDAIERCIRYKGERWTFSAATDLTQLAILKLLDPDRVTEQMSEQWRADPTLLEWLYVVGRQSSWHLPNMARVADQFHGPDDIFASRGLGSTVHLLPAQMRM